MTHASLFSGIGGAELAAQWMGWQNLFHCEIQEFPRRVLEYWFPESHSYVDITKTDFTPWRGRVDVLTGGFPCQPFSLAGRRGGADDDRYLWPQMLRAVCEVQPAWVVGENVAGLLTMVQPAEEADLGGDGSLFEENHIYRKEQDFTIQCICRDLERAGYSVQPFVVPACAVGAPHQRDRVWIVAHAHGDRQRERADEQKPLAECQREADHSNGGKDGSAAHAQRRRGNELDYQVQPGQPNGAGPDGNGVERPANHPLRHGRDACGVHDGRAESAQQEERREEQPRRADCPQSWWRQFPTQPPVCSRDDGLPFLVDCLALSFPKWQQESVKAYGNAWVPQVAYEIFRAIAEVEAELKE